MIYVVVIVIVLLCVASAVNTANRNAQAVASKCPSCQKLSAMIYKGRTEKSRKRGYATVRRTDHFMTSDDTGSVERLVQTIVVRVTYANRLVCQYCAHQVYTTTTEQFEPEFSEISDDSYDPSDDWQNDIR